MGGEPIRFNLTSDGWLKTVFGFDITTKFEKPSFLGGKQPENGTSEGLALRINLEKTQAEFLKQLDEKSQEGFGQLVKNSIWSAVVSDESLFGTVSTKITVVLKGTGLTKIAVVADGKVVRGEGWDFLKTYTDAGNTFRHAEVVARIKKLWHVSGKAGLKLEATQIVLRTTDKPQEADAFAGDAEILA